MLCGSYSQTGDHVEPRACEIADHGCGLAASIVETVCGLPTIPTKSWCDSAADALGGLFARSAAVVVVCTALADGSIRRVHGLGVSVRPRDPGTTQAADENAASPSNALDSEIRCGLEGMIHLGWSPEKFLGDAAEVRCMESMDDSDLRSGAELDPALGAGPSDWRAPSPISVLGPARASRMVAGIASVGPPELGRRIAVYVGDLASPTSPLDLHAEVMSACLPLVARKANRALDRTWTDKGSWLSNREKLVLEQLIIGRSVPEIASALGRSHHTVHDNVKSLHRKLAASTRGELIARALGIVGLASETSPSATAKRLPGDGLTGARGAADDDEDPDQDATSVRFPPARRPDNLVERGN